MKSVALTREVSIHPARNPTDIERAIMNPQLFKSIKMLKTKYRGQQTPTNSVLESFRQTNFVLCSA
jgi:hypothetical protein